MEEQPPAPQPKFWKRQFSETPTKAQNTFDVIFGVVVPIVLLVLDPAIFKGYACNGGYSPYSVFAYFAIALGMVTLLVWINAGSQLHGWVAYFAGSMFTGSVFAMATGILMLPYSLPGLIVVMGALGFVPFLTAFVYFRNGLRAFRLAQSAPVFRWRIPAMMLAGVLVVAGIPGLIQYMASEAINESVDKIVANRGQAEAALAIEDLKTTNWLCLSLCTSTIIRALADLDANIFAPQARSYGVIREVIGARFQIDCFMTTIELSGAE